MPVVEDPRPMPSPQPVPPPPAPEPDEEVADAHLGPLDREDDERFLSEFDPRRKHRGEV